MKHKKWKWLSRMVVALWFASTIYAIAFDGSSWPMWFVAAFMAGWLTGNKEYMERFK